MPLTNFPNGVSSFGLPVYPALSFPMPMLDGRANTGNVWFVDASNGSDNNVGNDALYPFATIAKGLARCSKGDTVIVQGKEMAATDTDPGSYAETVSMTVPQVSLIGVSRGRTQGGLPQMKIGAGSTAMVTVQAPGCYIANIGFNGASST